MAGRAVLARGGRRETYAPAPSVLVPADAAGDPLALARAFREALGCDECYVADLDAITGGVPQRALVRALAGQGGRLSVDAGVRAPDRARETLADGAARVVVGLETLPSLAVLEAVARAVGSERLVFSLDLRRGRPVAAAGARHLGTPLDAAGAAVAAGVAAIREAHPAVELLAGGGVASARDLERLADVGCDGALVATALHAGTVRREDIEAVRRRTSRRERHASDSR